MKTLEQCKDEVAKNLTNFSKFHAFNTFQEKIQDEAAHLYAAQFIEENKRLKELCKFIYNHDSVRWWMQYDINNRFPDIELFEINETLDK